MFAVVLQFFKGDVLDYAIAGDTQATLRYAILLAAIGMIDQLSYPLISLAEIIRQLVAIKPSCRSMEKFIEQGNVTGQGYPLIELVREIRYRNVSFAYPDEKPVLENFNFQAQKGRRYLISRAVPRFSEKQPDHVSGHSR